MKSLLIIGMLISTMSLSAGNTPEQCSVYAYPQEISQLMQSQKPFYDEDLSGLISIVFTVDEQNVLHVVEVESSNVFLKNHAKEAIDGHKLNSDCFHGEELYNISVDLVYAI